MARSPNPPRRTRPSPARPTPSAGTSVYLLYGNDEFRVGTEARRLADALCPPESQALGMEEIYGAVDTAEAASQALRQCLSAVQTVGFIGGRKLVWFRDVSFLKTARLLQSAAVQSWLGRLTEAIRKGLPAGHQLLISAREVDGRSALARACGAAGEVGIFSLPEREYEARPRAAAEAREAFDRAGLTVSPGILEAFLEKVGFEPRAIHAETEKLAAFLGPGGAVGPGEIERLVSPSRESAGWDYAAALFRRNLQAALEALRRLLAQKEEPIGLLAVLDNRCREALVLLDCRERRWVSLAGDYAQWADRPEAAEALARLGPRDPRLTHPYRAGMILKESSSFRREELEAWRRAILRTRERMVSESTPPALLVEWLTLELLARRADGPGAGNDGGRGRE